MMLVGCCNTLLAEGPATLFWIVKNQDFSEFLASADKPLSDREKLLSKVAVTCGRLDGNTNCSMRVGGLHVRMTYYRLNPPDFERKEIVYEMTATEVGSNHAVWMTSGRVLAKERNKFVYREDWNKPNRKKRDSSTETDDDGEHVVVFLDIYLSV